MLVLGIDPGTATTGFGFVREEEDGEIVAVHYGVVSTQAGVPMPKRLQKLYVDPTDLSAQCKPDEGPIEEMVFGKNITASITVSPRRGIALQAAAHADLPIGEYKTAPVEKANDAVG